MKGGDRLALVGMEKKGDFGFPVDQASEDSLPAFVGGIVGVCERAGCGGENEAESIGFVAEGVEDGVNFLWKAPVGRQAR